MKEEVNKPKGFTIKQYTRGPTIVQDSQSPMVDEWLVVACPMDAVAVSNKKTPKYLMQTLPNNFSQKESKAIPFLQSSRRVLRLITQEVMLMVVEIAGCELKASSLAQRKFTMRLLCEMAGSVMDTSGEILEY